MKFSLFLAVGVAISSLFSACGETKPAAPSVVANLQAAYNGESNASAKYAFYADEAEKLGYKSVAALFRATSTSEGLHAARQGAVLESMGITPVKEIKLPAYVDIKTSLADAIKGENYEIDTMYPTFLADAKAQGASSDVIEAFQFAIDAEKEHSRIYGDALVNTEAWKAQGKEFVVCLVCGYTLDSQTPAACKLCAAPGENFKVFK